MELNPTLVGILGLFVVALGWLVKKYNWSPQGKAMLWSIVGVSLVFGAVQVLVSAQTAPFPPMPADPAGIVFAWIPNILGWVAASAGAVFAVSQVVYSIIMKGLAPEA